MAILRGKFVGLTDHGRINRVSGIKITSTNPPAHARKFLRRNFMFRTIARIADRVLPVGFADAHCDVPCGIYDPRDAIQAAQTVIRMTELIEAMGVPSSLADYNSFVRYVTVKEEHAEKAKHDVLVLWTDYFKPEHLAAHPQLHTKVWEACKLGGHVKQHVDMDAAQKFKAALEEIGEAFAETKR